MIQGSGIKGKLRATAEFARDRGQFSQEDINVLFGPPTTGGDDFAGALIAGDARTLLFPVRSLSGVFAYTTSYDVLGRFKRDRQRNGNALPWYESTQVSSEPTQPPVALVTSSSKISASGAILEEEYSVLAQ